MKTVKKFIRAIKISESMDKKKRFEKVLFDYWKYNGELSYTQRIDAIKNVVEMIKKDSSTNYETLKNELLEAETANDKIKNITFTFLI